MQWALAVASFFTAVAAAQTAKPSIGVFLDFDSVPSRAAVEIMKKEVASLLKPTGLALDWRSAAENLGTESFAGLVVLKFRGKCRVESWTPPAEAPSGDVGALGTTKVAGGRVLPFSEVKCDALKQALSYLRPETNAIERQQAFGLAMGRVVAHELYHILARTTAHATRGLAKAAESLEDLVSQRSAAFASESSAAIRNGLH